jgi:hypothetical protein
MKIHYFLSGLPPIYKDQIHFDESKTLKEEILKEKCLYE